jgi:hypothetical protein
MNEKSKPENTSGYMDNIDGEAIYGRLNTSKRPEPILSLALVEDKLNRAIHDARLVWHGAALRLGAELNVDEYKAFEPLPSSLEERFRGLWKDPSNRHSISGFYSMQTALSELLATKALAQLQGGTLSQDGLLGLLDAFHAFGFGMSVLTDGYIKEDFDEMRNQALGEGFNDHLAKAREASSGPSRKMRAEANRLYEDGKRQGILTSKNSAKHALKSPLIEYGQKPEVGFEFTGDNIEETIYSWLLYPNGKPKKKKSTK